MAPHSSALAWKIPWTEEPGKLPSMGSHRVWRDWGNLAAAEYCWLYLFLCIKMLLWCGLTSLFWLCCFCFSCHIPNIVAILMSKSFVVVLSSISFIISGIAFKYSIKDEFTLFEWNKTAAQFPFLHVVVQFFPHYWLKSLLFPHWIFLTPLWNISWLLVDSRAHFWTLNLFSWAMY